MTRTKTAIPAFDWPSNAGELESIFLALAAIAVAAGITIRLLIAVPILGIKLLLHLLALLFPLDRVSWDNHLITTLTFIENHVLQAPLFFMSLMRYITPTLDDLFMSSLSWVDQTYALKHQHDADPSQLRPAYYPSLHMYRPAADSRTGSSGAAESATMYVVRFARRAVLSLAVFGLSFVPYVGRLQSTAYLITKISDPPPPPSESEGFAASQAEWRNKQKFLSLSMWNLDDGANPPAHPPGHDKPPPYSEVDPHPVGSYPEAEQSW
ncbi:hypothetical protein N0V88_006147 [Collariella sp. IMI 366227]|nr:hypothetical protein N0V88_006147 [Collariella sp. IMI 366227]